MSLSGASRGRIIAQNARPPEPLPAMSEARFIDLETKLAYQEDASTQLSDVVARQQQQIDALEAALRALIERVENLKDASGEKTSLLDEVPPHY